MFRLVRFFSVTSAVALLIVAIMLGGLLRKLAVDDLIEFEESRNVALTHAFLSATWPRFGPHVTSASGLGGEELRAHPETTALRDRVLSRMRGLSVVKVKIYNLEGITVFSTEESQIGGDASENAGYLAARSGRVVSELTHRGSFSAFEGVVENLDVISSYIPIRADARIEGVFELYSDVTPLLKRIDETQKFVLAAVLLVLGALFIVLFFAVRLADRITRYQHIARQRAEVAFEAAKQADRAKSEFLSRMSHELRTPMNAMLGFGQLLEVDESLNEKQREFVDHILEAGTHLLTLVDEVLDIATIESGRMALSVQAVKPAEVLEDCMNLLRPLAAQHKVTLEHQVAESAPMIRVDETRLKQVLVNLLSNAVKYNHEGGRVDVFCAQRDGRLRISVCDTGPGIPEGSMAELFEPFARLGAERSETQGTGLGLTVTKRLVELMNGTLGVESTMGNGSIFWVEFALA